MRKTPLITGRVYHIFNRGVNKQAIFFDRGDYTRFLKAAVHYKTRNSKFSYVLGAEKVSPLNNDTGSSGAPKVDVLAYCLMPNHFHFLIKQLEDGGITNFMRRLLNSYAHYVNIKQKRVGPLFTGRFKNVAMETDEQLLHVSRYIHLNPLVSGLTHDLGRYSWSSYSSYVGDREDKLSAPEEIIGMFTSSARYREFVMDQAAYGKELERIKHLIFDSEN